MFCCIDLKSFYATVECIERKLDPFKTPLVVCDVTRGKGSVVLAVSPYLKKLGVQSRTRIYDLPDIDIIYAKPRMNLYIEYSSKVYEIFLSLFSKDDVYVYSIDESFIKISPYLKLYKLTELELCKKVLNLIYDKLKLTATCGIGENLFLAKVALDIEAKKNKDNIFQINKEYFYKVLHYHKPLTDFWGIGENIKIRLEKHGIYTLRDISLNKEILIKEFGLIGKEIYEHSLGIDNSKLEDIKNYKPLSKSFGYGQVLFRDYNKKEIYTILLEMTDVITLRLIKNNLMCKHISIYIGYSNDKFKSLNKSLKLDEYTNSFKKLYNYYKEILDNNLEDHLIRKIRLSVSNLESNKIKPLNIFDDSINEEKEEKLYITINKIKEKYGRSSINKAVSHTKEGTMLERNKLVGGPNAG